MSTDHIGKYIKPIIIGIFIGGIITFGFTKFIATSSHDQSGSTMSDEKKPLYWVAPMDANYRKDKAGNSPMGMYLVPVYDDGGKGPD